MLLRDIYSSQNAALYLLCQDAALCLLFPYCCAMSTFSTLLRHASLLFPPSCAPCLLFHFTAPCLLFPCCCTMSTFSMVLRHIHFYNTAAPRLLFPPCRASLLRHCCSLDTAALCLLFPRCYTVSIEICTLFPPCCGILPYYIYFFHAATLCRVGVIKIVIVINCNLITFSKVIACNCN